MNRSQEAAEAAAKTFASLALLLTEVAESYAESIPFQLDPDKVTAPAQTHERVEHVYDFLGRYLALPTQRKAADA